ncbi:cupredoxin domain-containing protein [Sphingomonas sp. C3-2]|uniref:cupredoxin domain-containing protein n=1 Tax=Sphingomonas sp. C3-2 TaxID=3062169 RepID=UPI00294B2291|nr:cupredoxin domain-containing protein [Sphingomonas sp. C3-2]WOK35972.1 cupredoxin domain-containing protein [Sphingomonas sp. C3-2]
MSMTHRPIVLAVVLATATPGTAAPDWDHAARVAVSLSSFAYAPDTIRLRAGEAVVLHLVNTSSGGHDFTAPAFFAASEIRAEDRAQIDRGRIEVPGKESRTVALVPRAGEYPLKCSHSFHKMLGMSGHIIVR